MTKEEILTDALDHIAKVAGMARTLTKRLDWIVARAKTAIQGDEWDNSYKPMPSNSLQRVERLRFQIEELTKDKARLDWLEKSPRLSEIHVDGRVEDCYFYGVAGAPCLKLREIIDAAIAAEEQAN